MTTQDSTIDLAVDGRRVYFLGHTYPVRHDIRNMGGKWDADRKAWWVGKAKLDEAKSLVSRISRVIESAPASHGWAEIHGNTYPVRDELKGLGGRWNSERKVWEVPAAAYQRAKAIVDGARSSRSRRSSYRCRGCGGPLRDASHHRAMGGYCGYCAFDEFDC